MTGLWNPHWLAFAASLGRRPDDPEVGNVEFMCWVSERFIEFRRETGAGERLEGDELAEFGVYLSCWAEEKAA